MNGKGYRLPASELLVSCVCLWGLIKEKKKCNETLNRKLERKNLKKADSEMAIILNFWGFI